MEVYINKYCKICIQSLFYQISEFPLGKTHSLINLRIGWNNIIIYHAKLCIGKGSTTLRYPL